MADTSSPLAQLADIAEPPWQSGFALAPIWWLLIVLIAGAVLYLLLRLYRRWRFFAAKREALAILAQLDPGTANANELNLLVKRVLHHYQPGHPALSMDSVHWQRWLAFQHALPLPDLSALLYQNTQDATACAQFYYFAKAWLTAYRGQAPRDITATEVRHA